MEASGRPFRIAAAQVPSVRGDVAANVAVHVAAVAAAAAHGAAAVVFPELSLTGYEPDLAATLQMMWDDARLSPLGAAAREHGIAVTAGVPIRHPLLGYKPWLGAVLWRGAAPPQAYAKMHLGQSEGPYFTPGGAPMAFAAGGRTVGLAICADASQPSHAQHYADTGASVYAAGVFQDEAWYATDMPRLRAHAARTGMLVLMANHGASSGTLTSVGKSAAWAPDGTLLAEARGTEPCLVTATWRDGAWTGEVIPLPVVAAV